MSILAVLLFSSLCFGQQIKFISEFVVDGPVDVAASGGKVYLLLKSGDAVILSEEGQPIAKVDAKDREGKPVLKAPSGITTWGDTIYITDTGLDTVVMFTKDGNYLASFGGSGSDPKEFDDPAGIFVHGGVIYVADSGNGRVQVFGPNGVYLRSLGAALTGEGLLKKPVDVAVDYGGLVRVVDAGDRSVETFKMNGEYVGKVNGFGFPVSIAMGEDGFYIADREKCNISKFGFDGQRSFSFGIMGEGRVRFRELTGIYAASDGKLYAADRKNSNLQVLFPEQGKKVPVLDRVPPMASVKWQGELPGTSRRIFWDSGRKELCAIDEKGGAIRILSGEDVKQTLTLPKGAVASAVVVDRQGNYWVSDQGKDRLLKLDRQGKVLITLGSSGSREGFFSKPRGLAISREGLIHVADTGNARVQVFDGDGVFLKIITKSGEPRLENVVDICIDDAGKIYLLDASRKRVSIFAADGAFMTDFGSAVLKSPVAMALTPQELLVADADTGSISSFSFAGEFLGAFGVEGSGKGDFKNPVSIAISGVAGVMVADSGNKRIQNLEIARSPQSPAGLEVKNGMHNAALAWEKSGEAYVEAYKIYRADGDGEYAQIATVKDNSYADAPLLPGKTYSYRIAAVAVGGNESVATAPVSAAPEKYAVATPEELKAQAQEWSVELSWKGNKENWHSHYVIYRENGGKAEKVGESKTPGFLDGGLEPATPYVYQVAAVSTDGVESQRATIGTTTAVATRPPIEFEILEMNDIFSNSYKIYETRGIGKLRIINNTGNRIASMRIGFTIKEFMDFPTEIEVKDLPARDKRDVALKAVLNNKILEVTEDTPVQTEILVSYYENQKLKTYTKSHTLTIYEKHRMVWGEKGMVAAFITPKDPVVMDFTRSVVTQYAEMSSPLMYAGIVFDSLGMVGVSYMQDPSNPYQIVSGKNDFVDYVQFPRETLKRRSGDCDDLVILYSAALESLGIRTLLLDYPGHMFMMFAAGSVTELGEGTMAGMFIIRDGYVWIPLEVTMVGSSFMKAWEGGIRNYYDWKDKGLSITDPAAAWEQYKPASLPVSDWRPQALQRADLDKKFDNEVRRLRKIRLKAIAARYTDLLAKNPADQSARLQMGVLYAEAGETEEAENIFRKYDLQFPDSAAAANNLGNLKFLDGKYEEALQLYEKGAALDPTDPHLLINIARCELKLGDKVKAAEAFKRALALNPDIGISYRTMALELMGVD